MSRLPLDGSLGVGHLRTCVRELTASTQLERAGICHSIGLPLRLPTSSGARCRSGAHDPQLRHQPALPPAERRTKRPAWRAATGYRRAARTRSSPDSTGEGRRDASACSCSAAMPRSTKQHSRTTRHSGRETVQYPVVDRRSSQVEIEANDSKVLEVLTPESEHWRGLQLDPNHRLLIRRSLVRAQVGEPIKSKGYVARRNPFLFAILDSDPGCPISSTSPRSYLFTGWQDSNPTTRSVLEDWRRRDRDCLPEVRVMAVEEARPSVAQLTNSKQAIQHLLSVVTRDRQP